jgi:hypothetical protein
VFVGEARYLFFSVSDRMSRIGEESRPRQAMSRIGEESRPRQAMSRIGEESRPRQAMSRSDGNVASGAATMISRAAQRRECRQAAQRR